MKKLQLLTYFLIKISKEVADEKTDWKVYTKTYLNNLYEHLI